MIISRKWCENKKQILGRVNMRIKSRIHSYLDMAQFHRFMQKIMQTVRCSKNTQVALHLIAPERHRHKIVNSTVLKLLDWLVDLYKYS